MRSSRASGFRGGPFPDRPWWFAPDTRWRITRRFISRLRYQMSQQSPLSKSLVIPTSAADPLTLANGFNAPPNVLTNNFGIDPNFKLGYVQTWQVSVQRDLPASLQMLVTYLGNKGTRSLASVLSQLLRRRESLSFCARLGSSTLTSNGNSTRESGSVQLRRRLHNGFTATLLYTYAKAIDDSAGLGGGAFGGAIRAELAGPARRARPFQFRSTTSIADYPSAIHYRAGNRRRDPAERVEGPALQRVDHSGQLYDRDRVAFDSAILRAVWAERA